MPQISGQALQEALKYYTIIFEDSNAGGVKPCRPGYNYRRRIHLPLIISTTVKISSAARSYFMYQGSDTRLLSICNMIFAQNMYSIKFDRRESEKARQIESNLPTERPSSN